MCLKCRAAPSVYSQNGWCRRGRFKTGKEGKEDSCIPFHLGNKKASLSPECLSPGLKRTHTGNMIPCRAY